LKPRCYAVKPAPAKRRRALPVMSSRRAKMTRRTCPNAIRSDDVVAATHIFIDFFEPPIFSPSLYFDIFISPPLISAIFAFSYFSLLSFFIFSLITFIHFRLIISFFDTLSPFSFLLSVFHFCRAIAFHFHRHFRYCLIFCFDVRRQLFDSFDFLFTSLRFGFFSFS
jgi:hypothetical protein